MNTTEFKVGQKLKVTGRFVIGHDFRIGEIVTAHTVDAISVYAKNECGHGQWVSNSELELVERKFKVGDKVIGNSLATSRYGITQEGWIGTVTDVDGETFRAAHDGMYGLEYHLDEKCFELYDKTPHILVTKFKVGDKVTVKTGLISYREYGATSFVKSMIEFMGKSFTVSNVTNVEKGTLYKLNGASVWNFTDEMLDLYVEPQFTKRYLKSGYVVEYRSGELRMIMPYYDHDGLVGSDFYYQNNMGNYNEDLTDKDGDINLDIVAVFGFQDIGKLEVSTKGRELLWGRK